MAEFTANGDIYCSTLTVTLAGSEDFYSDLTILAGTQGWTDDVRDNIFDYSDGYRIEATQVLSISGVVDNTVYNGMCFGSDVTSNGAFCHIYQGDGITTDQIA